MVSPSNTCFLFNPANPFDTYIAVNTLFSGLFCAVVAITVLVIDERPDYWYLDPVEGGLFGLFMGVYGVKCIVDHVHSSEKDLEKSVSSYILIP